MAEENRYDLSSTGKQIDDAVSFTEAINSTPQQIDNAVGVAKKLDVEAIQKATTYVGNLLCGTTTITVATATSFLNTKLSLGGITPTENTAVIATLRIPGSPNPTRNYCLTLLYYNGAISASICAGQNSGQSAPESTIAAGTYYIDWMVIRR